MSLENKTMGIVFIENYIIKEHFEYELIKLKVEYKTNLIPILKKDNTNSNIDKIIKITQNKPIYYDEGIILEKYAKSLDFLILVGCGDNIIYKIANQIYDNNILKLIRNAKEKNIPIILGINIKKFDYKSLRNIEILYKTKRYYFLPFKISNPITKPDCFTFDSTFLIKTLDFSLKNIQIKPILSFL